VPAHTNIAAWTKKTGVKQVVTMSSTGVGHSAKDMPQINWDAFGDLMKRQEESERILKASGVDYTIIRIGAIISERGKPPHPATGKSYLTEDLSKYAAVAYDDLIAQTVACVDAKRCRNKTFVIADDTLAGELPHFICRRFAKEPDKECAQK
jgi:nucleoside-diphosphate-sugar epimerase